MAFQKEIHMATDHATSSKTPPQKQHEVQADFETRLRREFGDAAFSKGGWILLRQGLLLTAWIITVMSLGLFIVLYLHQAGIINMVPGLGEAAKRESADFRNLLTVLLPLFGAAIFFVVSAAGMKRLQAYDSEFARMREERREDASDLRDELRGDIKEEKETNKERFEAASIEFRETTKREIADLREDIVEADESNKEQFKKTKQELRDITQKEVEVALREGAEARTAELNANFATLQEKSIEIEREISDKFGILVEFPSIKSMADDRPASAGVAHRNISILFQRGKIDEAVAYTLAVLEKLKANNASGTPTDWFNISSVLGSNDQEKLGYEICLAAIEYYRRSDSEGYVPNIDLLAHGIQYAAKSAEYEQGLGWIEEAGNNGRAHWNWRMYIFVADFYDAIGDTEKLEEVEKDFRKNLSDDQRSVTNTAVRLKQAGNNEGAYKRVKDWIEAYEKRNKRKPFAETAYFLLTDISVETGKFADAITFSALALGASVGDQPSVNIAAIWFYRASAFDALFLAYITDNIGKKAMTWPKPKGCMTVRLTHIKPP